MEHKKRGPTLDGGGPEQTSNTTGVSSVEPSLDTSLGGGERGVMPDRSGTSSDNPNNTVPQPAPDVNTESDGQSSTGGGNAGFRSSGTLLGEDYENVVYIRKNENIAQLLSSRLQLPSARADDTLITSTISQSSSPVNPAIGTFKPVIAHTRAYRGARQMP